MTYKEARDAFVKAVAEKNNITTPDQLLALGEVCCKEIDAIPQSDMSQLYKDIRRDSGLKNASHPKGELKVAGG